MQQGRPGGRGNGHGRPLRFPRPADSRRYAASDGCGRVAAAAPAGRRRAGVHRARGALPLVHAQARPVVRVQPGGRRGGRAGHLARGAARPGPVRGAVVAAHLAVHHPRQPGADAPACARRGRCRSPTPGRSSTRPGSGRPAPGRCRPSTGSRRRRTGIDAVKLSGLLRGGLDGLPARQREVVLLRDVEGLSSAEVCQVLAISEANQRVLLHRGRSRLQAGARVGTGRCAAMSLPSLACGCGRRPRELPCQQVVELVTDYLEGALPAADAPPVRAPPGRAARTAPSTWPRSARRSGWPAGSPRKT